MFWGTVPRQPWQTPEYYSEQKQTLRPNAYRRLHQNEWVTGTESFIAAEDWDACVDETLVPMLGGFASRRCMPSTLRRSTTSRRASSVQICGDRLVLVGHRIWKPAPGEPLDLEETVERDLRECHGRGHCAAIVVRPVSDARVDYAAAEGGLADPRDSADAGEHDGVLAGLV